jgi:hypothetical protein
MIRVKPIGISERDELEPMLAANPDAIEPGLLVIAR